MQKLRICGSEEDEFILCISVLITVIVTNCLSLGAALWLNKIIDYVNLFRATKTLLWFIPTEPVVHRSALFSLVSSDEEKDLETLTEMMKIKDTETVINRPNQKGETALHRACQKNSPIKVQLLIKKGAQIRANSEGEMPAVADILISLINSDRVEDKNIFDQMMDLPNIPDFVNLKDRNGTTALHAACQKNLPREAALLIKKGAQIRANSQDEMPIFSLMNSQGESCLETFLEVLQGAEVDISDFINKPNNSQVSPFQLVCSTNDAGKAISLWSAGAKLGPSISLSDYQSRLSFLEKHTFMHPLGIQHVVECPALGALLENWSAADNEEKKEAEQKIAGVFNEEVNVIFIPAFEVAEEKKKELRRNVKEWNKSHTSKCE